MRIESVRFDASGNPTFVATGGISFYIPLSRADELLDLLKAHGGLLDGDAGSGRRASLKALPVIVSEFEREDDVYILLASIDEEERARHKAIELCARAEQFSHGLAIKLAAKGFSRKAVKAVVDGLVTEGILDDARYARVWARGRAERRAAGPALLAAELRSRGLGEGAVKTALQDIDFSRALARAIGKETARLEAAWRKKGLKQDERFHDALYWALKKQGFDPEEIRDLILKP
ncbi:MAG: RecX family transcriptional regulator [Rectinemataceae bacterium]|nr:RecX family transcriptional regulator [Rectinemataceae bacterium]